ncbi:MAG TPA: hypothetical protein VHN82_00780 [Methanoregula sp.]|nr:hypothetical protein [Methanoregula sp.]
MQEIRLSLRKRAFPSRGRARLNAAHLPEVGITEGEQADLVNEATGASVTVTIVADTLVLEGQVRVSAEDLTALGLSENEMVLIRKTPPLNEKIRKMAEEAGTSVQKGVDSLDRSLTKTAGNVKIASEKASKDLSDAAKKTAGDVKKAVRKTTGKDDL